MDKEDNMRRHVRLAQKHIRAIEKLGYVVDVGHNTLDVSDYSTAPPENERGLHFDPSVYVVESIA